MGELVPEKLRKLTLIDNSLADKSIAEIFDNLTQNENGGLVGITIINNDIGRDTLRELSRFYVEAPRSA